MQNDREIKKSIVVSKALKQKDAMLTLSRNKTGEQSTWIHSVVRDELQRPLVITDQELYHLQSEEAKSKTRLEKVRMTHEAHEAQAIPFRISLVIFPYMSCSIRSST